MTRALWVEMASVYSIHCGQCRTFLLPDSSSVDTFPQSWRSLHFFSRDSRAPANKGETAKPSSGKQTGGSGSDQQNVAERTELQTEEGNGTEMLGRKQ